VPFNRCLSQVDGGFWQRWNLSRWGRRLWCTILCLKVSCLDCRLVSVVNFLLFVWVLLVTTLWISSISRRCLERKRLLEYCFGPIATWKSLVLTSCWKILFCKSVTFDGGWSCRYNIRFFTFFKIFFVDKVAFVIVSVWAAFVLDFLGGGLAERLSLVFVSGTFTAIIWVLNFWKALWSLHKIVILSSIILIISSLWRRWTCFLNGKNDEAVLIDAFIKGKLLVVDRLEVSGFDSHLVQRYQLTFSFWDSLKFNRHLLNLSLGCC